MTLSPARIRSVATCRKKASCGPERSTCAAVTVRPRGPSHRTIGRGTNPSPFDRLAWATIFTPLQVSSGYDLSIGGPKDEVEEVNAVRPRIMNRALALVFVCTFGTAASFYLLLSVVPLYATSVGAGGIGAGGATGALMLATVAAELATPRLLARFGYRLVLAAGLLLLGAPALALSASANLPAILAVCLVRGLGFAITVVVGSALVASLVPRERRGEGLGLYGVVVGVPSVVALALGVWLAAHVGYGPVFVAAAVTSLAGLVVVPGLPGREPRPGPGSALERTVGVWAGLRTPALLRPSIVFAATTMAAGVIVTFLPLVVTGASGNLAALALLVQAATATLTRWWAGRHGDRHGPARLLIPGVATAAVGMLALVLTSSPAVVVVGMVVFGAGFGVTQNASLLLMFERVSTSGYGTVSALWNLAYDAGLGVGAAGFGVLAAQTGYAAAFGLTAAVMLAALAPAWRDRTAKRATL
jgi:predicted MFS family arabinose efflux permease